MIVDGKPVLLEVTTLRQRFGIRLARKDSDRWVMHSIEDVMSVSLFTTSLIRA